MAENKGPFATVEDLSRLEKDIAEQKRRFATMGDLSRLEKVHEAMWRYILSFTNVGAYPRLPQAPVQPWSYLVRHQHPWRRQLYVKGRNMTARQLVGGIKANNLDETKAAANYKLPVEAIREALAYVEENKDLLAIEAEIEQLMLKRGGVARGPQAVSWRGSLR